MDSLRNGCPGLIQRYDELNFVIILYSRTQLEYQASIGNGVTAILAGITSQVLEDALGHIGELMMSFKSVVTALVPWFLTFITGPFQGAIALTFLALLMVLSWNENYGESNDHKDSSIYDQFSLGWNTTLRNSSIWKIGLTQALSEGAMYTVSEFCSHIS